MTQDDEFGLGCLGLIAITFALLVLVLSGLSWSMMR